MNDSDTMNNVGYLYAQMSLRSFKCLQNTNKRPFLNFASFVRTAANFIFGFRFLVLFA